jgi:Na+/H+ antiporter NhaC
MNFFAYLIIALVVIPIIMLLQKGLGMVLKKEDDKKDMQEANKSLGKTWLFFAIIVVAVIIIALANS